jgi:(p)ppGpp synthase/HD superfamily hydrolase
MMTNEEKYLAALTLATAKHNGQTRKEGIPYVTHPIAVAEILRDKGYGIDYQLAGLFHDLLEDTDCTEQEIEEIGGSDVLAAVKLLTKQKGYVMANYMAGIRKNPIAFAVKGADRLHNLRCASVASPEFRRRYIRESREWFLDFSPEIAVAVDELEKTLESDGLNLD